ncbi:hypothetical protein HN592_03515 [Candidatus Woesearchaeota archaeon]|jgi:hypothetical protein|nr:hypothetical protein [Candidatus Woesearchaeota archaeon]MBT4368280.1 hypothetical protein [Candidatus Woesearchaeota archaeon]MBT4712769.1 hypothetical protein [Candidatus Woesearchaeota archaeon]MBT6639681.1 hypothetical protein [Candidatus Woesearchaeota archaeon]MBT7133853.1 hypothetical protein [Candidatus Woesearchaeota archaeon]
MDKLLSYIKLCRSKGFSDEYIRSSLKKAGHQEFIINRALINSGGMKTHTKVRRPKTKEYRSKNFGFPMKSVITVIIILAVIVASLGLFSMNRTTEGRATELSREEIDKLLESTSIVDAKNQVIQQQIDKINALDISLEEKQELIVLQTEQIEELFEQVQKDRKANLQYSIELINSILNR